MANVVRQDVVQIGFDIGDSLKEIKKLQDELNDLKKKLAGGVGEDAFDGLKDKSNESVKPLKKVKEQADKVTKAVTNIGGKAAATAYKGLKKVAGVSFKGLTVGIGAAAAAMGTLTYKAVQAYADSEQLVGGVDTLFKTSSDQVQKYADDAFKNAGVSANTYMETVTSFSASLINSVGGDTAKAAELANMAIIDMSDNANKMGTDMEMVIQTYQSIARGNYEMLDNLKLGYGGTKTELQRLIKDAAALDKSIDANSMSYANIVKSIHAVQEQIGITGTTQLEAEETITGSLNMVKASWQNLMPALIKGGDSFDRCVENLLYSMDKFSDNAMPALQKALGGVGKLIEKLAPKIEEAFPKLVDELLPPLLKAAASLIAGLIKALPNIIKTVAKEIPNITKELVGAIYEAFTGKEISDDGFSKMEGLIKGLATTIQWAIPIIGGLAVAFKGLKSINSIKSVFSGLGKSKGFGGNAKKGTGIFGMFQSLANMNTKSVLKGIGNLAIILGGLGALLWLATKVFKDGVNFTQMFKVIALIGIFGVVGTVLGKFAGIVGMIPVMTVVKGLLNIGIILVGMGALLFLAAKVFSAGIDFMNMLKVIALIGILGTVGSVLSVFAGIVGLIPIPVVLSGLANIALVINGFGLLLAEFAALNKIPGFLEFMKSGGEVLITLFNILGKVAGSLIGGLAEGISNALPKIGENLGKFGENMKPLFAAMQGIDMNGVGSFFTSIVALLGMATGNEIIEGIKAFFGGGEESSLEKLGTQLTNFANNAQGFFNIVAGMDTAGFSNAKLLFESLAGMSSLPTEGGIKGWFSGDINYDALAAGLGKLSSDSVVGFFNTVASIPAAGFDQAKLLFDTLAGLKSLPTEGGIKGWFGGDVNYSKISSGLRSLSSEGVKNFFSMVGGFEITAFDNAKRFFDTLAGIESLPTEGGLFGWAKEKVNLSGIGTQLSEFAKNAARFLTFVNNLNVENMNALFDALKNLGSIVSNLKDSVTKDFEAIADNMKSSCGKSEQVIKDTTTKIDSIISSTNLKPGSEKMMKTFVDGITGKKQSAISAIKSVVSAIISQINNVIHAANYTLKAFGSSDRIDTYSYAKGTNGHPGGNAVVNDGRGAELVQMPNGNAFIPSGRNVFIPNAPKGMKVLPAESTAALMGRDKPAFHYAKGTGDIDIWDYMDNAKGLVGRLREKFVDYKGLSGAGLSIAKGAVMTVSGAMDKWLNKLFEEFGIGKGWKWPSLSRRITSPFGKRNSPGGIGSTNHKGIDIGAPFGSPVFASKGGTVSIAGWSGGYGNLVQINHGQGWSSRYGHNSKLLVSPGQRVRQGQTIALVGSTGNSTGNHIHFEIRHNGVSLNPLSMLGTGYANGGLVTKPGWIGEENKPEMVIPLSKNKRRRALSLWEQTGTMLGYTPENSTVGSSQVGNVENTYSPQFTLNINGANDDKAMERKVKRWIKESMDEVFDSMSRKNPRLREV